MARFGTYALLTVLAVIPSLALGRSELPSAHSLITFPDEIDSEDAMEVPSNADGFYYTIRSGFKPDDADLCADIDDNGNVVMKDCDETNGNQLWYSEGTAIKHVNTDQCWEVCVTNCKYMLMDRRRVWIKECNGAEAQQFVSIDGKRIQSVQNGNCLDVCNSMTCNPRGDLITFPCHDNPNQQWFMVPGTPPAPVDILKVVNFAAQVEKE